MLAKIKEKLFNRRNTVIVESLEGDLDLNGNIKANNIVNTIVVSNIKQISDEILSSLKAGDIVQKEDSSGKHSYIVSFKKDGTGICLTYTDASVVETQSYDYTDGHWVYNSEDKTEFADLGHTDDEVKVLAKAEVESATAGTIVDALGLDSEGHLVKGQASGGGLKLYKHSINLQGTGSGTVNIQVITTDSTQYTSLSMELSNMISNSLISKVISGDSKGFILSTSFFGMMILEGIFVSPDGQGGFVLGSNITITGFVSDLVDEI